MYPLSSFPFVLRSSAPLPWRHNALVLIYPYEPCTPFILCHFASVLLVAQAQRSTRERGTRTNTLTLCPFTLVLLRPCFTLPFCPNAPLPFCPFSATLPLCSFVFVPVWLFASLSLCPFSPGYPYPCCPCTRWQCASLPFWQCVSLSLSPFALVLPFPCASTLISIRTCDPLQLSPLYVYPFVFVPICLCALQLVITEIMTSFYNALKIFRCTSSTNSTMFWKMKYIFIKFALQSSD